MEGFDRPKALGTELNPRNERVEDWGERVAFPSFFPHFSDNKACKGMFQKLLYTLCYRKNGRMEGWEPNLPSFHPSRCQVIFWEK